MGLRHDRYVLGADLSVALHPYSYGYVNQRAFDQDAPEPAHWTTIMGYPDQCLDAGLDCPRIRRFSNPDRTYQGDPLGVPGDIPSSSVDGPADARRTLNATRGLVASFRSRACTDFTVSPESRIVPSEGGQIQFKVSATPGCLWEAESGTDFMRITSDTIDSGSGTVTVEVESGEDRTGTLTLAGRTVTVHRRMDVPGVCGRTSLVSDAITERAGFANPGEDCTRVTASQLAAIVQPLDLEGLGIQTLKKDDFAGLFGLNRLDLAGNELMELSKGVFAGLTSLERLDLNDNQLTTLPEELFAGPLQPESDRPEW